MPKIELGRKPRDLVTILGTDDGDQTQYPVLHIDDTDDPRLTDLPDTGECRIKYKVRHRTHSEHTVNGKKKCSCSLTLDVHSIEPPPGKSKKKNGNGYGDDARKSFNNYFKDK